MDDTGWGDTDSTANSRRVNTDTNGDGQFPYIDDPNLNAGLDLEFDEEFNFNGGISDMNDEWGVSNSISQGPEPQQTSLGSENPLINIKLPTQDELDLDFGRPGSATQANSNRAPPVDTSGFTEVPMDSSVSQTHAIDDSLISPPMHDLLSPGSTNSTTSSQFPATRGGNDTHRRSPTNDTDSMHHGRFINPSNDTTTPHNMKPGLNKLAHDTKLEQYSTVDWLRDFMITFRSNTFRSRRKKLNRKKFNSKSPQRQNMLNEDGENEDLDENFNLNPNGVQQNDTIKSSRWKRWKIIAYDTVDSIHSWILVVVIAVILGTIASSIAIAAAWANDIKLGRCTNNWYLSRDICCRISNNPESCPEFKYWGTGYLILSPFINWVVYTFMSTFLAYLSATMVNHYAPMAAGSGNAEIKTILGGFNIKGFLSVPTTLIKSLALPLMVASGLAIGKEGPMIHLAAGLASMVTQYSSRFIFNEARKREFLAAASAAGIGVAFAAPIGGVLFTLEELSSFFPNKTMLYSFFCALFATVTVQLIDPYRGKRVLYEVPNYRRWNLFEIILFIILGIFGGIVGGLVIKINQVLNMVRKSTFIAKYPIQEVVVVAFITSIIFYLNSFLRMDSSDLLEQLFQECSETPESFLCTRGLAGGFLLFFSLLIGLFLRIILSSVSFGLKVPAGTFIPAMVWGALFGRLLGMFVESYYKQHMNWPIFQNLCQSGATCITPGMYAVIGAFGGLAGVTRMTLSLTVIAYELTGTLDYIVPCMITVLTAKTVGDYFTSGGIAEFGIRANRYPFLDPNTDELIGMDAKDFMTLKDETVALWDRGMRYHEISYILNNTDYSGFPVIKRSSGNKMFGIKRKASYRLSNGKRYELVGYIRRIDLEFIFQKLVIISDEQHTFAGPEGESTPVNVEDDLYEIPDALLNKETIINFCTLEDEEDEFVNTNNEVKPVKNRKVHPRLSSILVDTDIGGGVRPSSAPIDRTDSPSPSRTPLESPEMCRPLSSHVTKSSSYNINLNSLSESDPNTPRSKTPIERIDSPRRFRSQNNSPSRLDNRADDLNTGTKTSESLEDKIENFHGAPIVANPVVATVLGDGYDNNGDMGTSSNFDEFGLPQLTPGGKYDPKQTMINLNMYLDKTLLKVCTSTDIEFIVEMFQTIGLHHLIVEDFGFYEGVITKKDLLAALWSKSPRIHAKRHITSNKPNGTSSRATSPDGNVGSHSRKGRQSSRERSVDIEDIDEFDPNLNTKFEENEVDIDNHTLNAQQGEDNLVPRIDLQYDFETDTLGLRGYLIFGEIYLWVAQLVRWFCLANFRWGPRPSSEDIPSDMNVNRESLDMVPVIDVREIVLSTPAFLIRQIIELPYRLKTLGVWVGGVIRHPKRLLTGWSIFSGNRRLINGSFNRLSANGPINGSHYEADAIFEEADFDDIEMTGLDTGRNRNNAFRTDMGSDTSLNVSPGGDGNDPFAQAEPIFDVNNNRNRNGGFESSF